ncbi:MAG: hypothetical protein ACRD0P_16335 [Stackebrandtia sp.]
MRSQWNTDDDDVPAKLGQVWGKTRDSAATGKVVAIAASVVAIVLIVAFVAAMAAGSGDSDAAVGTGEDAASSDDTGGPDQSPVDATYPGDGTYTIQVRHTGYCLGLTQLSDEDRQALVQTGCRKAEPEIVLAETSTAGTYAITLVDDDQVDCLTLDADEPGQLLGPRSCEESPSQSFSLTPVDEGVYRVLTGSGLCLGVAEQSIEPDAVFNAVECSTTSAAQQLVFKGEGAVATLPTKLGAWWARDGVFTVKWEKPDDDGGLAVTGYVIRDCEGKDLATVDGDKYTVDVEIKALTCVNVRAVNAAGEGAEATNDVVQK